ncbi:hypothetical protein AB0G74_15675 [Streptomyces sp. NPDC020875]|uniref:hypothetical protein n=1 Tax=Streptomyces sp. NPDC020875 TaxID=3154898 RepID=UPI0033C97429
MADDELARMRRIVAEYDSLEDPEQRSEFLDIRGYTRGSLAGARRAIAAADRPTPGEPSSRAPRRTRRRQGSRRPAPVAPPGRPRLRRRGPAPRKVVITLRIVVEFP